MEKLQLIPVIHIENGQALIEDQIKGERFYTDPVDLAVELDELGFDEVLIVDDDGDKKGEFSIFELIYEIAGYTQFQIIVKGGIRSFASIERAFEVGASRVMLSTLPITDAELVSQMIDVYGSNSLIIAMEIKNGELVYENKQNISELHIEHIIDMFTALGMDFFSIQILNDLGRKQNLESDFFDKVMDHFPRIRLYGGEGLNNSDQFESLEKAGLKGAFLGDEFYTNETLFAGLRKYLLN